MRLRHYISYAALAAATFAAGPAWAQAADAPASPAASEEAPAGEIIVTGTRRTDRTVTESAVPIDVFSGAALETQASGDMNQILKNLVPSFNVGRFGIADGSTFVRPPTLRGLPPDQTLVLVNGKRRHRSALVQLGGGSLAAGAQGPDLAQIPSAAIERIEVLRDGAAAQYGSDAIAGVINYGLKRNRDGLSLNARFGQYYEGDGEDYQLSGNLGLPLGPEGFFNVSGEYLKTRQTIRSTQRPDALVLENMGYDVKEPAQIYGNPASEAFRFFVNAAVPFGEDELYFFGNYGESDQAGDFNYRRPISVTVPQGPAGKPVPFGKSVATTYLQRITAIDPRTDSKTFGQPVSFWNANGSTFETSQFFPNGFTPRFMGNVSDVSAVLGYKGEFEFGLKYDLSGSYGQSRIKYTMGQTLNPSMGPESPTFFYMGKLEQQENNFNLDLSYPLEVGLASPLNIAGGLEYRRETYIIGLGDVASYQVGQYAYQEVYNPTTNQVSIVTHAVGSNGFPGYGPDSTTDQSRRSYAAYLDLEVDVTDAFTLGVAGRYEDFSDFGSTTNGKVTARYEFTPAIAVRGAASTGFRAPTPGQLFTRNVATVFTAGSPLPIAQATLPVTSAAAQFYGATPLSPEKSVNFSGGVVLTPGSGLNVTLDYYNIRVKDRIGLTGQIPVLDSERPTLQALGVADWSSLGQVVYFTNGFKTRTQGVDFVATHNLTSDIGHFASSLAVNYNKTKLLSRKTTVTQTKREFALISNDRLGDIENLNPKWRVNLAETWSYQGFSVTGRGSYYGKITDYDVGGDQSFGSEILFDLEVSYTFNEKYKLAVGAENIFDNYPDRDRRGVYPSTGALANGRIYLDDSPIGFNGGFWYVRAGVNF
ncbi:TonB-dependent receptor [Sphingomonas oleivorans]|uniref:TonB-dependent receptor n=1 Tax=Sphingomonas oleivorans TaxID=1735121 RepID=A0A2T5FU15_9SPHN|nr:TonB-dependent receptor [Sphingomonas oleivorans]PTQ07784.1 TonB-dependent receptor [Sphingomonas oleivorans]